MTTLTFSLFELLIRHIFEEVTCDLHSYVPKQEKTNIVISHSLYRNYYKTCKTV